ncbi:pirin family protein [Acinetobacter rudis]|uniref:Pirin family protein n=1 Tax=Acinetobacter rudis TaxID=632955 RepID=A0AAW8J8P0_9GAMM|nr:pirin family protein [Acinetobacter rudis]MDQ8935842.1 pirin family protein [Acinetobacter rudis]MDQ9018120.1 pirin family protein [Acinetobacter rudis]
MFDMRLANARGTANHGWLKSHHTFSFANYWDPKQVGFSDLLVINDDNVAPAKGFGTHPHRNMEIISYVLDGALEHKDSMGTGSVIVPGDIQLMSAGSGIAHSEFNHSNQEQVHFLQIWVVPNQSNTSPSYQQINIAAEDKRGKLHLMISPQGGEKTLAIKQDINIYAGLFDGEESAEYNIPENRYTYIHVAKGRIQINGQMFNAGDAARIRETATLKLSDADKAEILIFDMRPNEVPSM